MALASMTSFISKLSPPATVTQAQTAANDSKLMLIIGDSTAPRLFVFLSKLGRDKLGVVGVHSS